MGIIKIFTNSVACTFIIFISSSTYSSSDITEYKDNELKEVSSQNTCPADIDCDDPSWFYMGGRPDCCMPDYFAKGK